MKKLYGWLVVLTTLVVVACHQEQKETHVPADQLAEKQQYEDSINNVFGRILDSSRMQGAVLVWDATTNTFYCNDTTWAKTGQLPASTFKIPNSMIALETGVVESDTTVLFWNGEKRRLPSWEQNLSFWNAFRLSCLPCYQEIARKVGVKRMKKYLKQFNYGKMQVNENNLDLFWVEGTSVITPYEQIDFLNRYVNRQLGLSDRTTELVARMMIVDEKDGKILRGKTGWSIENEQDNGWFVGYLEEKGHYWFFATNIEPGKDSDPDHFAPYRFQITLRALEALGCW